LIQEQCKRCGNEIPGARQVGEIVSAIPIAPSLRADDDVYAARLAQCASCGDLREGVLCAWCGCYVQFRARPKAGSCPSPSGDRWVT